MSLDKDLYAVKKKVYFLQLSFLRRKGPCRTTFLFNNIHNTSYNETNYLSNNNNNNNNNDNNTRVQDGNSAAPIMIRMYHRNHID